MISQDSTQILNSQTRGEKKIKAGKALRQEEILGIIYGKNIKTNIPVVFSRPEFLKILAKTGEGTLIKLIIDKGQPKDVIIQEIQYHTLTDEILHIDFLAVSLEEEVEVEVPLSFEGESPAVKDLGGILVQNIEKIEVRCKAKDIPESIKVDISSLATFDDAIALKDLIVPSNIELLDNPDNVIAIVDEPRSEKDMEELETEATADVTEVEGVKKEETAEGEEAKTEEKKEEE